MSHAASLAWTVTFVVQKLVEQTSVHFVRNEVAAATVVDGWMKMAVAGRKILTLLLPRVGNNPSGGFILLPGDFFAEDHLLERHPQSVSLGRPS
ncbi:hypothetical protein MRX96_057673 [Rhipicephalus microplus]